MGRFKAVIRLIRERLEALSLRKGIAALCILTAVTMFSFAAPFALSFSYAETTVDGQEASQEEGNTKANQNTAQQPEGGQTEANGTAESTDEPQTTAEDTTYKNDATKLKELLGGRASVTISAEGIITEIAMDNPLECLIILSNVNPELYENANLKFNVTGEPDLSLGTVTVDSEVLTFKGLGSEAVSFKGYLDINNASVRLSRPLFNSVTLENGKTYSYKIAWVAADNSDAIIASQIIAPQGDDETAALNAEITLQKNGSVTNLNAPAAGDTKGNLELNVAYKMEDPSTTLQTNIAHDDNAGLLVNSHCDGALKLTSSGLSLSGAEIKSLTQNAGLLVGRVYKDSADAYTSLELCDAYQAENNKITAKKSAGGLIGAIEDATLTVKESIDLSGTSVRGDYAGGVVGYSKDAKYRIEQNKNIKSSLAVGAKNVSLSGDEKVSSQYAGGLFGVYETSSETTISMADFDFSQRVTLEAKKDEGIVGGLAGKIALTKIAPTENESNTNIGRLTIDMPENTNTTASSSEDSESAETGESGAAEGESSASSEGETGESSEGGLLTNLLGEIEGLAEDADAGKYGLKSTLSADSNVNAYGGVVGQLTGTNDLETGLTIRNMNAWAKSEGKAKYKSGIAAIVGTDEERTKPIAMILENAVADMENADTSDKSRGVFGGAAALVGSKSVVYDKGNTTITTTGKGVTAGGGLIGDAGKGSAVRLAGITDISGVIFDSSGQLTRIGQLVGVQDSALVYADGSGSDASETGGWDYIRSGSAQFDDIGNYGQVYRFHNDEQLAGLITMNETYQVSLTKSPNAYKSTEPETVDEGTETGTEEGEQTGAVPAESGTDDPTQSAEGESAALAEGGSGDVEVEITDLSDFARLAITIQTEGYFSGYDTIDSGNWDNLRDDTLNLTKSISLTGTGITGITRDSIGANETPAVFTGTINGGDNKNKITLSIGEAYGKVGSDPARSADCCGLVYRHNRLGLFSYGNGGATNLTIDGNINFEALEAGIAAGAYSAYSNGGDKIFTGCRFEPTITYKTNEKLCCVGGVIGMLDGTATNKITFTGGTRIAPTISIDAVTSKGVDVTGGAIGYVGSSCPAEIKADNTTLSADISNKNNTYTTSLAGGYIGIIMPSATTNYNRVSVTFNDTKMDGHKVNLKANSATGGLLGYMWADTNVSFKGGAEMYGLSVVKDTESKQTELTAETSTAGGLVYRASGKWTINDKGINLGGAKISGVRTSFGLLVCRGAYNNDGELIGGSTVKPAALYLELTAPWDEAYPLSSVDSSAEYVDISCSPETYDEFVAFSMGGQGSFANNQSGIISLQTVGNDGKVIMDGSSINTYINRSSYGISHKINGSSRYYYNLDKAIESIGKGEQANNNNIDTPEELLIWSVNIYAGTNIKQYFEKNDAKINGTTKTTIGTKDNNVAGLDMSGYSYYPVTVNNRSIDIRNARITFYNKEIEASEKSESNKLTREYTQHYAMHCGLFRDFNTRSADKDNQGNYSLNLNSVTMTGTVGLYNDDSSGALISGQIVGFTYQGVPSIYSVKVQNCDMNNLKVDGMVETDCAPLLIRSSDSYSEIFVNGLNVNEECRASSLIGDIGKTNSSGDSASTQLTVNFSKISVPSADKSVFTRASLLNSFSYNKNGGVASAIYNFSKADYDEGKFTLGREIDGTKEYKDLQLWFYDVDTYGKPEGLVTHGSLTANTGNPVFVSYLPYVYVGYDSQTTYHEMKINHMSADIIEGCGTYYDPYVITSALQMTTVADFINNNNAGNGLKITVSDNLSQGCRRLKTDDNSTSNHITYISQGDTWYGENDSSKTISKDTLHRYMQSAYYDIQTDLTLEDFVGLGNSNFPFRGVIISSKNNTTIMLKRSKGYMQGFIPCSYGTVIKNLTIEYKDGNALAYTAMSSSDVSPNTYFGGVFGLILGGDNIIDNVKVKFDSDGDDKFTIECSDDTKKHLVPIGGYVGAISGGGILFRGMGDDDSYKGITDNSCLAGELSPAKGAYNSLYVNPIVGRVISGYAFSEGCTVDNTNKNYKICELVKEEAGKPGVESHVVRNTTPIQTTVHSGQGLMVLSAIIQSGAGAGHINDDKLSTESNLQGTKPYFGKNVKYGDYCFGNDGFGKVRNASYEYVGNPNAEGSSADFSSSVFDDTKAPGLSDIDYYNMNTMAGSTGGGFDCLNGEAVENQYVNSPYLVRNYATKETEFVCASHISLMSLRFEPYDQEGKLIDVSGYGNAYTGLTGRFISNAVSSNQTESASLDRVIPYVTDIRGNGTTIKVNNNIREYVDDDFNTPGAGALFSTVYWGYSTTKAIESISDNEYCLAKDIRIDDSTISIAYYNSDGTVNTSDNNAYKTYQSAGGGLFGSVAYINAHHTVALIKNVNVTGTNITGFKSAGSIAGTMGYRTKSVYNHTLGKAESLMSYNLINCSYSGNQIEAQQYAGGFVGRANSYYKTDNTSQLFPMNGITVTDSLVTGQNSIIKSGGSSGGIVGKQTGRFAVNRPDYKALNSNGSEYYSAPSSLKEASFKNIKVTSTENAAGIVGEIDGNSTEFNEIEINNVSMTSVTPEEADVVANSTVIEGKYLGGIIGKNSNGRKYDNDYYKNCEISNAIFNSNAEYYTGGIIGYVGTPSKAGSTVNIVDSSVNNCSFMKITTGCRSGGIIGNIESHTQKITLTNIVSADNTFNGTNCAGLINICRGEITGSNILASNNTYPGKGGEWGLLFSWVIKNGNDPCKIRLAGVSVKKSANNTPTVITNKWDGSTTGSYLAFSDYTNTAANGVSPDVASKSVLGTNQAYPYVTTSPLSNHTVKEASDSSEKHLFGDGIGAVVDGNAETAAETIMNEVSNSSNPTRYKYSKVSDLEFSFNQSISTFNANNENDKQKATSDIPVIRVSGGDTSGIEKYLDIVTNGGYSDAKALNPSTNDGISHVSAEVSVYEWNYDKTAFVKATDAKPSIVINNAGTNSMSFRATTEYDNGRGRFSMITVTFSEAGGEHKVHVPVIVRRILEIDYTATLNYGTVFKQSEYSGLGNDAHILESFGNSVTALITYKYNSAYGSSTEYGWDSYLAAGGSMGEVEKNISFSSPLPSGTKLSLVDCLSGKVYTATHDGSGTIALTEFKDSSGNPYKNKWLSELMKVTAKEVNGGIWVKCVSKNDPNATARDDENAYRLAGKDDAALTKYNLTVAKASGKEIQPKESFYLVINVPLNDDTKNLSANGFIYGSAGCGDVPVSMNYTIRPDSSRDNHQNTASTYSFLSGYTHSITDGSSDIDKAGSGYTMIPLQKEGQSGRYINVKAQDKISFNSDQNYNDKDSLFYKLDINLLQHSSESDTSSYFATGTEGTAKMFVMIGDNYYHYSGGSWIESKSKTAAAQIPWKATAENKGELSLTLKEETGKALDLAGVRAIAKSSGSEFTIVTEMDLHLSDPAVENSIMGSLSNGKSENTRLNYRSALAVREESLSYSRFIATCRGTVGYYRPKAGSSIITYSANDIKQLGINCSELDTADGNIETTGTYSFEDVVNAGEIIGSADRIVYSLRLFKRNDTKGSYHQIRVSEEKLKEYLTVGCTQLGDPVYTTDANGYCYFTWTDYKTDRGFETAEDIGKRFTVNIPVKVYTDNVEAKGHIFANYRLVLTAEMYNGNKRIDYPFNSRIVAGSNDTGTLDDHSDYVTYTLTRVATDELINNPSGTGN